MDPDFIDSEVSMVIAVALGLLFPPLFVVYAVGLLIYTIIACMKG